MFRLLIRLIPCLLLLQLFPAYCLSDDPEAPPSTVTTVVETPHVAWAKPLRGGPMSVLFVTPQGCARDVVELNQRLDARMEAVLLWDARHLGLDPVNPPVDPRGFSMDEVKSRLEELLSKQWDVLILANFDLSLLPESAQQRIAQQVSSGAGLLLANHWISQSCPLQALVNEAKEGEGQEEILRGTADTGARGWLSGRALVNTAEAEAGRIIQFSYPSDPPQTDALLAPPADPLNSTRAHLDNAYGLILRALLWSARRLPEVRVTDLIDLSPRGPDEEEIPPGLPPEFVQAVRNSASSQPVRPFLVQLNAPAPEDLQVRLQLRKGDEVVPLMAPASPLKKGETAAPVEVLSHPGRYYLDVWLETRKGIEDWFSKEIELTSWPEVRGVRTSKTFLMPHDAMDLSVELNTAFSPSSRTRLGTVYARAVDSFGRVVAENYEPVSAESGQQRLSLQFADLLAPLVKLTVHAIEGPARELQPWELLAGPEATVLLPVRLSRPLKQPELVVGATVVEEFGARAMLNLLQGRGATGLYAPAGDTALVYAAQARLSLLPELARYTAVNAADNVVREPCLTTPEYQQAESLRVQEMTGFHWAGSNNLFSLGRGNCLIDGDQNVCQSETCLTGFQQWLQGEYGSLEALNASWKSSFAAWEEVRPPDRNEARTTAAYGGWVDFRIFMDSVFSLFHGRIRDSVRAVDGEALVGAGFLTPENPMHGYHWPQLLRRLDYAAVEPEPLLLSRLQSYMSTSAQNAVHYTPQSTSGTLWDAMFHGAESVWWLDAFSTASSALPRAAVFPDGRPAPAFAEAAGLMSSLREGLGALLAQATPETPQVMLLESAASRHLNEVMLEPGEGSYEAERRWLTLIRRLGFTAGFVAAEEAASLQPGSCKLLVMPHISALSDSEAQAIAAWAAAGGTVVADTAPGTHDEHGVPRESAVLASLFTAATPSAHLIHPDTRNGAEALLSLAEKLELKPAVELKGNDFDGTRFRFHYGAASIVALLATSDAEGTQKAQLQFSRSSHLCDLRTGLPMPRARKLNLRLAPGEAAVVAELPYAVEEVVLLAPETALTGRRLEFRVGLKVEEGNEPEAHLVRIDLAPELGTPLPHYRQFIRVTKGVGGGYLALARNEPLGRYILSATDLLSGVRQQVLVNIGFVAEE